MAVTPAQPRRDGLLKRGRGLVGLALRRARWLALRGGAVILRPMLGVRAPLSGSTMASAFVHATGADYKPLEGPRVFSFGRGASFKAPETYVLKIPNGRVFGESGVVITPDNELLNDVSVAIALPDWRHPALMRTGFPEARRIEKSAAVISSVLSTNYWHWMIDVLPRLDLLQRADAHFDKLIVNAKLPFQQETLRRLGVDPNRLIALEAGEHIEVAELFVPSLPAAFCTLTPEIIHFLRSRFLPSGRTTAPTRRVYVSRKAAARRRVLNEDALMARLAPLGFEAVILERLSVADQAKTFASAEIIVGPHGAGFTNLVFASPGAGLVDIMPDAIPHPSFEMAASLLGCRYAKVGYMGPTPAPLDQTFDIDEVLRQVHAMLAAKSGVSRVA